MKISWPGFTKKGAVIIKLPPEPFCLAKETIDVYGESFTAKDELHVTLIGNEIGSIILNRIKQDQTINKLLKKTFEKIDWSFKQTGPVHILSRSEEGVVESSIILLIEMPGVTAFYDQLKALGFIESETALPPPHVTMYTQNCPLGIGVPNDETLNALSREILPVNALNKLQTTGL